MFRVPPRTGPPAGETQPARARLVAALNRRSATSRFRGVCEERAVAPAGSLRAPGTLSRCPGNA